MKSRKKNKKKNSKKAKQNPFETLLKNNKIKGMSLSDLENMEPKNMSPQMRKLVEETQALANKQHQPTSVPESPPTETDNEGPIDTFSYIPPQNRVKVDSDNKAVEVEQSNINPMDLNPEDIAVPALPKVVLPSTYYFEQNQKETKSDKDDNLVNGADRDMPYRTHVDMERSIPGYQFDQDNTPDHEIPNYPSPF